MSLVNGEDDFMDNLRRIELLYKDCDFREANQLRYQPIETFISVIKTELRRLEDGN